MDEIIRIFGIENAYLVKGDHCYLVDTMAPMSRKKIYAALEKNKVSPAELSHILITHYHFDHTGNLCALSRESDATILAGAPDVPYIEGELKPAPPSSLNMMGRMLGRLPRRLIDAYQKCEVSRVDGAVRDGMRIDELGLEVISLPGHTRGGTGYLDRANRRAFIGDLVSNYFGRLGLPALSASYSIEDIEYSMKKLAALELDYMYPGHGRIIGPDASARVSALIRKKF
jgi:glyoxylase-like metal-dependent hydrolase (beta-lactamase superfamily II)